MVEDAVTKGAELRCGGAAMGERGYFFAPTVLANVPDSARIKQEEPFGPIAILNPVRELDEAIARANALPYGLAGYGFTNRADYMARLVDEVEVGNLSINTLEASLPETRFGGVKASGYGREGGTEGLESYLTIKNVWHSAEIR
ncbi:aldehyde dehydrogenase family protein [Roseovarius sp.]|uniref:aldehyde dehydrogenase family protein n=1 Tax=Roseovarius sp. TaxID=1486281 RepID=UPI0035167EE3